MKNCCDQAQQNECTFSLPSTVFNASISAKTPLSHCMNTASCSLNLPISQSLDNGSSAVLITSRRNDEVPQSSRTCVLLNSKEDANQLKDTSYPVNNVSNSVTTTLFSSHINCCSLVTHFDSCTVNSRCHVSSKDEQSHTASGLSESIGYEKTTRVNGYTKDTPFLLNKNKSSELSLELPYMQPYTSPNSSDRANYSCLLTTVNSSQAFSQSNKNDGCDNQSSEEIFDDLSNDEPLSSQCPSNSLQTPNSDTPLFSSHNIDKIGNPVNPQLSSSSLKLETCVQTALQKTLVGKCDVDRAENSINEFQSQTNHTSNPIQQESRSVAPLSSSFTMQTSDANSSIFNDLKDGNCSSPDNTDDNFLFSGPACCEISLTSTECGIETPSYVSRTPSLEYNMKISSDVVDASLSGNPTIVASIHMQSDKQNVINPLQQANDDIDSWLKSQCKVESTFPCDDLNHTLHESNTAQERKPDLVSNDATQISTGDDPMFQPDKSILKMSENTTSCNDTVVTPLLEHCKLRNTNLEQEIGCSSNNRLNAENLELCVDDVSAEMEISSDFAVDSSSDATTKANCQLSSDESLHKLKNCQVHEDVHIDNIEENGTSVITLSTSDKKEYEVVKSSGLVEDKLSNDFVLSKDEKKALPKKRKGGRFSRELCCLYEDLIDFGGGSLICDDPSKEIDHFRRSSRRSVHEKQFQPLDVRQTKHKYGKRKTMGSSSDKHISQESKDISSISRTSRASNCYETDYIVPSKRNLHKMKNKDDRVDIMSRSPSPELSGATYLRGENQLTQSKQSQSSNDSSHDISSGERSSSNLNVTKRSKLSRLSIQPSSNKNTNNSIPFKNRGVQEKVEQNSKKMSLLLNKKESKALHVKSHKNHSKKQVHKTDSGSLKLVKMEEDTPPASSDSQLLRKFNMDFDDDQMANLLFLANEKANDFSRNVCSTDASSGQSSTLNAYALLDQDESFYRKKNLVPTSFSSGQTGNGSMAQQFLSNQNYKGDVQTSGQHPVSSITCKSFELLNEQTNMLFSNQLYDAPFTLQSKDSLKTESSFVKNSSSCEQELSDRSSDSSKKENLLKKPESYYDDDLKQGGSFSSDGHELTEDLTKISCEYFRSSSVSDVSSPSPNSNLRKKASYFSTEKEQTRASENANQNGLDDIENILESPGSLEKAESSHKSTLNQRHPHKLIQNLPSHVENFDHYVQERFFELLTLF